MLKHIKTAVCPNCNAPVTTERAKEYTHVNGHRHEERHFACGVSIEHVPAYINREGFHERLLGECTRSQVYKDKYKKRRELTATIINLLDPVKQSDSHFVDRIVRELKFLAGE